MTATLQAWPFVIAAYAVSTGGTAALVAWSFVAMRRAEARADALSMRGDDRAP